MTLPPQLAEELDPNVPDLSPGVANLLVLLSNEDQEVEVVARELEYYPVIAARLIALANSAWSAPDRVVEDLKDACIRLGLRVVRSSAIAYAVAAPFDPLRCKSFDPTRFWCCSLLAADAAEQLAQSHGVDASHARLSGIFRNLGMLWLADAAPDATNDVLIAAEADPVRRLRDVFASRFGASYLDASVHLFRRWGLPDYLLASCEIDMETDLGSLSQISNTIAKEVYLSGPLPADLAVKGTSTLDDLRIRLTNSLEKINAVAQSIAAG